MGQFELTIPFLFQIPISDGYVNNVKIGGGFRYQGGSYASLKNELKTDAFTVLDAAVHSGVNDSVRFSLNGQNLFDKKYFSTCYGRTTPTCVFGKAKTVSATLDYRW